ncbi:MAG: sulfatase-like hydrolase/transferase, partial [Bryobacteraceae bacterium]|nr:sulfatase-like hydrolase/transferase [Bryobacteraceae bacterium]
ALERLKLADSTIVVFWSDHGYQLGEHGQWMKQTLFEPSARVPLLIGGPGVEARGAGSARTVELLDLYPTLAELCSLKGTPSNLHGRSLAPLVRKPDSRWEKPAVTQVRRAREDGAVMGYSIRTERYRYTMWANGSEGEELYDYRSDPRELRNRAADTSLASQKRRLRDELNRVLRQRGGAEGQAR